MEAWDGGNGQDSGDEAFPETMVAEWRSQMEARRREIFKESWKNRRAAPNLRTRTQERDFAFVLEWHDESGDMIARNKERNRLDALIELGLDVNAPENRPQ